MKPRPPADPTPALTRGLNLLLYLERAGDCSLDQLARSTGWPKSSVLRILRSLEAFGAVRRDGATQHYQLILRLAPVQAQPRDLKTISNDLLEQLSESIGATTELYTLADDQLVLTARSEPRNAEVVVRARLGHARRYNEVEALTQVVVAFSHLALPSELWYWKEGIRHQLSETAGAAAVAAARSSGVGRDLGINCYGVYRLAAPIRDPNSTLIGILASARAGARRTAEADAATAQQLRTATTIIEARLKC